MRVIFFAITIPVSVILLITLIVVTEIRKNQSYKEVSNMCQFHMIEMPKFRKNLKREAEAQGLDYSQSPWFS